MERSNKTVMFREYGLIVFNKSYYPFEQFNSLFSFGVEIWGKEQNCNG